MFSTDLYEQMIIKNSQGDYIAAYYETFAHRSKPTIIIKSYAETPECSSEYAS